MKSIRNLPTQTVIPLVADDIIEFHASRLLLLINICGRKGEIDSLTKLAKLDFFVRYPDFFSEMCTFLGEEFKPINSDVESSMVRFHYGPWDHRYYHVLAYLEARMLISVKKEGNSFHIALTEQGLETSQILRKDHSFNELIYQMENVRRVLGKYKGSTIKNFIYKLFDKQVSQLSLGDVIK